MCGIAGILKFDDASLPLERVAQMTRCMVRRGPDDGGLAFFRRTSSHVDAVATDDTPGSVRNSRHPYSPENSDIPADVNECCLALGHRRLSIVDLSAAGHQPMCTEDQRFWIVYNGEVYNFRELRRTLENLGERFISDSDTEVILKAFRQWGADCLQRFSGDFAFAVWDNEKKNLFCARDRIGIKPFYYYRDRRGFLFASDIKTLIASGIYQPEVDYENLYHGLSLLCAPRPRTSFRGVKALRQAHWLSIDLAGKQTTQAYWKIPIGQVDHSRSDEEWHDALEETLDRAVRRRLIADVPVGTYMSGGIDSTTVTAMAGHAQPGIKAFTLSFTGEDQLIDELPQAAATARMHPIDHCVASVVPEMVSSTIQTSVRCHEEPFLIMTPLLVMAEYAVSHGVKVVLNGLGADEILCGYGRAPRFLKRDRVFRRWESQSWLQRTWDCLGPDNARARRIRSLYERQSYADCYLRSFALFDQGTKRSLLVPEYCRGADTLATFDELYTPRDEKFTDGVEALCYYDLVNYVGNHHVYREDQCSMHFSLESRYPMLDHELVELAFRMPTRLKLRGNTGKALLRDVAKKWIAPSCFEVKKKQGFALPYENWYRGAYRDFVVETLASLKRRQAIVPETVELILTKMLDPDVRVSVHLVSMLLAMELWFQEFFDNNMALSPTGEERAGYQLSIPSDRSDVSSPMRAHNE